MISEEESHKVSIIVVNWNGERFLKDCLGGSFKSELCRLRNHPGCNGSSDNSVRFTRDNFPGIKIVALSGGAL
jgi:GT2 family glycosyltransferase